MRNDLQNRLASGVNRTSFQPVTDLRCPSCGSVTRLFGKYRDQTVNCWQCGVVVYRPEPKDGVVENKNGPV